MRHFPSQFLCNMVHQPSHTFLTYLLLCTRHLPSRTFSMGHSLIPFFAAFVAHHISLPYGVYKFTRGNFPSCFIMGYLAFPFNNFLDSWGTCPSHSLFCSSNISHFLAHMVTYTFYLTAHKQYVVHSIKIWHHSFFSVCFSRILVFLDFFSMHFIMGHQTIPFALL